MTIKIGDKVEATMSSDSFYKKARGVVTEIKNGFVSFEATQVISKWSKTWENHPTSCATSAKICNVKIIVD